MEKMSATLWAWVGVSVASVAAALAVVVLEARIESRELARLVSDPLTSPSEAGSARVMLITQDAEGPARELPTSAK